MHQPRVCDFGAVEAEKQQTGQPLKMHQSCIGDLGAVEVDPNNLTLFIHLDLGSQFLQLSLLFYHTTTANIRPSAVNKSVLLFMITFRLCSLVVLSRLHPGLCPDSFDRR